MGPIPRSGRWNPREAIPDLPLAELDDRAWEIRREVITSAQRKKRTPALEKVWENTLDEVKKGFCLGPFNSEESVSNYLGTEQWIATERFAREQKNKVRGVDSATLSEINPASAVSEDLVLASTDKNVDVLKHWFKQMRKLGTEQNMLGWVLDEADAYRHCCGPTA